MLEKPLKGKERGSDIQTAGNNHRDAEFCRWRDLEDVPRRQTLAGRIHIDFGAQPRCRLSKTLVDASIPRLLYEEVKARCEGWRFITPCERGHTARTSSLPSLRDLGDVITVDFMGCEGVGVIHIVGVF